MPPRYDEVARLRELAGSAPVKGIAKGSANDMMIQIDHGPAFGRIPIAELLNAAPWLLEVAGCFQKGDSNLMSELISVMDAYFGEYYRPHKAAMHRLLRAAKIMEEKESTTHD